MRRDEKCPVCGEQTTIDDRELNPDEKIEIKCDVCQTIYPSPHSEKQDIELRKKYPEKIFARMKSIIQTSQKVYDFLQSQILAIETNPEEFSTKEKIKSILEETINLLTYSDFVLADDPEW